MHGVASTQDAHGEATQFDSTDLSGYHVVLSVPDPTTGVFSQVTVTDRSGNQYQGHFGPVSNCGRAPTNFMIHSPGAVPPWIDDAPAGEQYCNETARASLITDSNGNQIPGPTGGDTLGRTQPLSTSDVVTDFSGCVSSQPIYAAYYYHYQDPNGSYPLHQVLCC